MYKYFIYFMFFYITLTGFIITVAGTVSLLISMNLIHYKMFIITIPICIFTSTIYRIIEIGKLK
jgi:hypothetical protein